MMTLEQILADIRSDRVKKVILDSDMAIEMDDQYALAYCMGAEHRIELIGINAATFGKGAQGDYAWGAECCYNEISRVLDKCGRNDGRYSAHRGPEKPIMYTEGAPVDCEAARAIVEAAHKYDELIYVLATGCSTNVASALLMDPSIKENICVIWLGANCLDFPDGISECNLDFDLRAAQIMVNSGVPFILLPAHDHGTNVLEVTREDLARYMPGDSSAQRFFRDELPDQFSRESYYVNGFWRRIIYDLAAPGVLVEPQAFEFSIIKAPVFTDEKFFAFDSSRHDIIYMESCDRDTVLDSAFKYINTL